MADTVSQATGRCLHRYKRELRLKQAKYYSLTLLMETWHLLCGLEKKRPGALFALAHDVMDFYNIWH